MSSLFFSFSFCFNRYWSFFFVLNIEYIYQLNEVIKTMVLKKLRRISCPKQGKEEELTYIEQHDDHVSLATLSGSKCCYISGNACVYLTASLLVAVLQKHELI